MLCRRDGSLERVKISELFLTEALDRVPANSASPGNIVAIAGIPDIMIGETTGRRGRPAPAAAHHRGRARDLHDDRHEHPLASREKGTKVIARMVKDRLDRELVGNVSLRVLPTVVRTPGRCRAGVSWPWPC